MEPVIEGFIGGVVLTAVVWVVVYLRKTHPYRKS